LRTLFPSKILAKAHWPPPAYNFPTYLEIFIEEDRGNGDGSLISAARVRSSGGNNIETETFGIYPARLTNIKVGKK